MSSPFSAAARPEKCPECRGPLVFNENGTATCSLHRGEYRVLFHRGPIAGPPAPAVAAASATEEPLFCAQHPTVAATHHCHACFAGICDTCDFALPDGRHFCPTCATDPEPKLSPQRTRQRNWAIGLAAFATFWWVMLFGGAFSGMVKDKSDTQALGFLLFFLLLVAPLVGVAKAYGAIDRRLNNPLSLRLAALWNAILIAGFFLLSFIGTMR